MSALFGPSGNAQSFYDEGYKSTLQSPGWIASKGLDAFEYSAGNGVTGGLDTFRKIGEKAKEHGIVTSFHTPYYISLSGTDPEKRLKSLDYIKQSLDAAEAMGAYLIVIHTGSASKISREEALELSKDTMYKALEKFPDTKVWFGLETMGKLNQLGTLEEVLDICKMDRRLCPVVDFGHLNARNIGHLFESVDDYRRVFARIGEVLGYEYADRLHCHFSKIEYTDKGEKRHLTFADTVYGPNYEPLMEAIVKDGYSPRIMCESAGTQAEDALAMKKYYQSLLS
ncbi:MAG: TIM barrel protein [Eubacteriales bacterium]